MLLKPMLTFRHRSVEMPRASGRAFALLGASLFFLCVQTSCEKTPPTASQLTTPATASSPAIAASGNVVGQLINFTADSERYRVSGWSKTEDNFAWTEGNSARLALPLPADSGALTVKMTLRGLIQPPALPSQPVEVYANGQKITDWQVAETAPFTAQVPAELTKGAKTLNLEFRIPKAASPKTLGMNNDERVLGICAYSIELARP